MDDHITLEEFELIGEDITVQIGAIFHRGRLEEVDDIMFPYKVYIYNLDETRWFLDIYTSECNLIGDVLD